MIYADYCVPFLIYLVIEAAPTNRANQSDRFLPEISGGVIRWSDTSPSRLGLAPCRRISPTTRDKAQSLPQNLIYRSSKRRNSLATIDLDQTMDSRNP